MKGLLGALVLCMAMAGCETEVVEHRYPTLADARADHLFERGWLPDVLPPSSVDIRTVNNLDVDTSSGSFGFQPSEASLLFGRLSAGASMKAPFSGWPATLADYEKRGFTAWSYRDQYSHWAFFCKSGAGRCEYTTWSTNR